MLSVLKKIANHSFVAPFYHTVSDAPLPHVAHLYPIKTIKQFTADLEYLLKHFKPIGLQKLEQYIQQHRQLPKNRCFLSFDDGFAECDTIIAPILQKKGIPAAFFINTAFINNKHLMYRCQVSLLIHHLHKKNNLKAVTALTNTLMAKTYEEKEAIHIFEKQLDFSFNNYLQQQKPYLSTAQIKNLYRQGFDIGSHSVDHPWFKDILFNKQKQQVIQSLAALRQIVPLVNSFSFPFSDVGITTSLLGFIYNQNIALTFACAGVKQDETLQHIQRLAMEATDMAQKQEKSQASKTLPKAFLAYLVKKILRTHKVVRPSSI